MKFLKYFLLFLLISATIQADEDKITITSPPDGKLMAAGFVPIKYTIDSSLKVSNIKIYVNDELQEETTALSYDFYTTEVKIHDLKIEFVVDGGDTITKTSKFSVTKKGIAVNEEMGRNLKLSDLNVAWYYNWGNTPSSGSQYDGMEYVPQIWSEHDKVKAESTIDNLIAQGYKYVQLFNEPDRGDQANMSVNDVYEIYRAAFQNKNILISAPMTSIWPEASDWFKEWTEKIGNDINYDFIVLHVYPDNFGGSAMAEWFVQDIIDKTYLNFKKPIWINEFSTIGNQITEESTIEFYRTFIPLVNERSYVVRYSPFCFKGQPWSLWDYDTGALTPVGKAFATVGNPK